MISRHPSLTFVYPTGTLTMRDETAKVPSYYTMPCCPLARIKLWYT